MDKKKLIIGGIGVLVLAIAAFFGIRGIGGTDQQGGIDLSQMLTPSGNKFSDLNQLFGAMAQGPQAVYVTATGDKYHKDGCRYLDKSKIAINRGEAVDNDYEPCKVCKPDENLQNLPIPTTPDQREKDRQSEGKPAPSGSDDEGTWD